MKRIKKLLNNLRRKSPKPDLEDKMNGDETESREKEAHETKAHEIDIKELAKAELDAANKELSILNKEDNNTVYNFKRYVEARREFWNNSYSGFDLDKCGVEELPVISYVKKVGEQGGEGRDSLKISEISFSSEDSNELRPGLRKILDVMDEIATGESAYPPAYELGGSKVAFPTDEAYRKEVRDGMHQKEKDIHSFTDRIRESTGLQRLEI